MSQAAPFSGLIEMPDTGPPATDSDVESVETGSEPQSGSSGFKAFWQNHQMIMMVIGLGVLLLTAVLVFRKSQSSNNAASNTTAGGGVPTTNTSDTATAIDQQNNAIEALMNAFQQWMSNQGQQVPPANPTSNVGSLLPVHWVNGTNGNAGYWADASGNQIKPGSKMFAAGQGSSVFPIHWISDSSSTGGYWADDNGNRITPNQQIFTQPQKSTLTGLWPTDPIGGTQGNVVSAMPQTMAASLPTTTPTMWGTSSLQHSPIVRIESKSA